MSPEFARVYNENGVSFKQFTGNISYDLLAFDAGVPCEEEPNEPIPVTGGSGPGNAGGGGSWGSGGAGGGGSSGGGGSGGGGSSGGGGGSSGGGGGSSGGGGGSSGGSGATGQILVAATHLALTIQANTASSDPGGGDDGEMPPDEVHISPRYFPPAGYNYQKIPPSLTDPSDPCGAGDEIGILEPPVNNKKECAKIKNSLQNAAFKTKITELSQPTSLALNFEKAAAVFDGSPNITEWQGSPSVPEVAITYPTGSKFVSFFHMHPDIPPGTLSVFSDADLVTLATLIRKSEIDNSKFVAYLSTKKGTYLAITISDPQKLLNFFYASTFKNLNDATQQGANLVSYMNSDLKSKPLTRKYFDPSNPHRLINETDTDNENVLKQFLNFLKEADAGIELFETDINFTNFKKLSLNSNGTINRNTSCP